MSYAIDSTRSQRNGKVALSEQLSVVCPHHWRPSCGNRFFRSGSL